MNFGIRPLPNLEAKFVAANSLIPLAKSDGELGRTPEIIALENKLKEANHKIFSAKTIRTKRRWKDRLIELRSEMAEKLADNGFLTTDAANQLTSWDMFDQNSAASFFDADWMFGIKNGFDVVIANPPYVRPHKISDKEKVFLWKNYKVAQQKTDLYAFFIELGCKLLCKNGLLVYITPKTWHSIYSFQKLRNLLLFNYNLTKIGILPVKVFDSATVETALLFVANSKSDSDILFYDVYTNQNVKTVTKQSIIKSTDLNISCENSYNTNNNFKLLGDLCKIIVGIVTGNDKKFCRNECLSELDKPCIRGNNIQRYCINYTGEYIWYDKAEMVAESNAKPKTTLKGGGLQCSTKQPEDFELSEKIVMQRISKRIIATLDTNQYYAHSSVVIIKPNNETPLKYILAILNSTYIDRWLRRNTSNISINVGTVKQIPITICDKELQNKIIRIVDRILEKKSLLIDTSDLENQIDLHVYKLYGLTYDEILVVDPETPITREEYESNN